MKVLFDSKDTVVGFFLNYSQEKSQQLCLLSQTKLSYNLWWKIVVIFCANENLTTREVNFRYPRIFKRKVPGKSKENILYFFLVPFFFSILTARKYLEEIWQNISKAEKYERAWNDHLMDTILPISHPFISIQQMTNAWFMNEYEF